MQTTKCESLAARWRGRLLVLAGACLAAIAGLAAQSLAVPVFTNESSNYLLVGMGPTNSFQGQPGVGHAIDVDNWELGANSNAVPSPSNPSLLGNVPPLPGNAQPVFTGIGGRGNVAVSNQAGSFSISNVNIHGQIGLRTAGPSSSNQGFSNSNVFGGGAITHNHDYAGLRGELASARSIISGLNPGDNPSVSFATLNLSANDGKVNKDLFNPSNFSVSGPISASASSGSDNGTFTVTAQNSGITVIDLVTHASSSKDLLLEKYNWVIDGGDENTFVIFRVPDNANMLISNGNVLAGNGGIGMHNVLFFSEKQDNDQHFNFSNTILNGVSFWTLGLKGGEINIDNAQGCTQLIADKINLNDVRFNGCAFNIPEPGTVGLLVAGAGFLLRRRVR